MYAIRIASPDGPGAAVLTEVPAPDPGADVVIDVHAAGVTYPDLLLSRGQYQMKPNYPFVPGSEVAGVVHSAPAESGFHTGDRVAGVSVYGGWAEQVAVPAHAVFPLPANVSFAAAAGIPMNYLTMHFGLLRRGRLQAGESVLVHGAAGGIGTAAIQVAGAYGATVIAVASSDDKRELALRAGAHHAVDAGDFRAAVADITGGAGVDLVVDPVGGDRVTDSLRSLRAEGRLLVIGFTGGEIPTVRLNRLLLNNVSAVGVGWGAYWLPRPAYLAEQWAEIRPHLESGAFSPALGHRFPLSDAAEALRTLDRRGALGKIVLEVR
ncbi:NADPH2:quinone reductase [Amycolatopsis bartoniae]|uniref:NADPH:quinone oxidoreductase n=1 Tax=Amycolatopsis bartoniae TaxID=941986 RepID=A0A8H9MFL3_9PSEU|nr:NADPH:quinone oxidoreductase family protein [Amycolatopsis bartoniae]MBB2939372.1 NADPH2:quinone reductase [Amycolatopsis bartoniae]TVT06705.1 NADPH:quinone oxidoreductase family protein [Amycolatopsis bartoniae]GHF83505.1 NADPH:quinone oxidoreductase [Amycolatopsis bartoniae]